MKIRLSLLILTILLTACQTATPPPPLTIDLGTEFTLVSGQSATLAASTLTIKLVGVSNDERCPSEIECAASGPVTLSISVQSNTASATEFILQTFTDYNGRAPEGPFEGIQDRIEFEDYLIRVVGVLPYPATLSDRKKLSEYRVTFVVTGK